MSIKGLQDQLAEEIFGLTAEEAIQRETCIDCGEPAIPNCYSEAGRNEYYISGLCEKCFDRITGGT